MFLDEIYGSNIRQPLQCPINVAMPFNHQTMLLSQISMRSLVFLT